MTSQPPAKPIPGPEETLALTRALLERSRATLAEISRRLAGEASEIPASDSLTGKSDQSGPSDGV